MKKQLDINSDDNDYSTRNERSSTVTSKTARATPEELKTADGEFEIVQSSIGINRNELVEIYHDGFIEDEWLNNIEHHPDYNAFKDHKNLDPSFVKSGIKNALATALPGSPSYHSEELERTGLTMPLSILFVLSYFGAFLYFAVTGALENSKQKVLSLEKINDNSMKCTEVPLFLQGSYFADIDGNWQSDPNFWANGSYYALDFKGTSITTDEYKRVMDQFDQALSELGDRGKERDMAWNLITLSTYSDEDSKTNMQIASTASATSIFKVAVGAANFFTRDKGMCDEFSRIYGKFDSPFISLYVPNGMNETDYAKTDFMASSYTIKTPCQDYITTSMIPYFELLLRRPGWSNMDFDIRSLTTSIAINMGIIKLDTMAITVSTYPHMVQLPPGNFYMDTYYTEVHPFYCLDKSDPTLTGPGADLCFLVEGGFNANRTLLLPWAVSLNYDDYDGPMCTCPSSATSFACNQMDIVFLMFYDRDGNQTQAAINTIELGRKFQKLMLDDVDRGDIAVSELVYPLARTAVALYLDPSNSTRENKVKAAFDKICTTSTCGAIVVESTPYSFFNPITENNLQIASLTKAVIDVAPTYLNGFADSVKQSMCTDYIRLPDAFEKMKSTYPTSLINDYYECSSTFSYSFKNSIGNAAGSASLFCAIFLPIMTYLIGKIYNLCTRKSKLYSITEKKKLDEKIAIRSKYALNNIIEGLVDELVILRHENIDNRQIISQLLTINAEKLKPSEYKELLESIKQRRIPDAALHHELIAFKRYFINEKKEAILDEKRTRVTGRPIEHEGLEKMNIEKAQALQDSLNTTKRVRLKKKKANLPEIDIRDSDLSEPSNTNGNGFDLLNWFGGYVHNNNNNN